MAQVIVRKLDENVKLRLQKQAARHGCSMEEEIRKILRAAVSRSERSGSGFGSRLRNRFIGIGVESEIKELRGRKARPATLKE